MGEVLATLMVGMLVCAGVCLAVVVAVVHVLAVRNRVVPGRRSAASLTWLVSLRAAARLHRRLRASVLAAHAAVATDGGGDLGLVEIVGDLRDRAGALDAQLVIASRAPQRSRRRLLRELQAEINELERLVERVIRMSRAWSGSVPSERGLSAVRHRLEVLESAMRELDRLDVQASAPAAPSARSASPLQQG